MRRILLSLIGVVCLLGRLAGADESYERSIEKQWAERVVQLTKPDGWLTLIGLHFLHEGDNTVGRSADNTIVLAAGPARIGTVSLSAAGEVAFTPGAAVDVRVDGQPALAGRLRFAEGEGEPDLVSAGTVSFFVIERGGRKALRVRDGAAGRRTHFLGLDHYPIDASWRIEADWVSFAELRQIPITNVIGTTSNETTPGKAVFQRDGRTYELWPIMDSPDKTLFFIFSDSTSGGATYTMRFLDAGPPKNGKVVLDFNLATNPPCAFTPFATCPLPPRQNHLPIAVTAGEKTYRGAHD
jgi:hypothetical protein